MRQTHPQNQGRIPITSRAAWRAPLRSGNRLKRQMVDSVTGDVVENEEQVKGYAVGKDQYVTVEDDELSNIAIESTRTVDIEKFVPKASIDDR
jgi:DNA end-binding protein Ku